MNQKNDTCVDVNILSSPAPTYLLHDDPGGRLHVGDKGRWVEEAGRTGGELCCHLVHLPITEYIYLLPSRSEEHEVLPFGIICH